MVGHLVFVGPNILRAEYTFKTADNTAIGMYTGICLFDSDKSLNQSLTHILCHITDITPMSAVGNLDSKILNLHIGIFYASFGNISVELLVIHIADAFEKQQGEDVLFIAGSINLTTQSCGSPPQKLLHLVECELMVCRTVF